MTADPDDVVLVKQALDNEQQAYRALMARHRDAVYRFVRAQVEDSDAALDLVQESFIAAFAHLDRFDHARPFRFWILRIALNKCRDWRRRRTVRSFFTRARPMEEGLDIADSAPDPDEQAAARQDLARVRRAIDALPDSLRSVLLLRTVEGMSQQDVAQCLNISDKAVETRLYRARIKLAALVREQAGARV